MNNNQITNSNVVNAGGNVSLRNVNFNQTNNQTSRVDFYVLSKEIAQLKLAFEKSSQSEQHQEVLRSLEAAEKSAKANDLKSVLAHFRIIGSATLKLAKDIGVALVATLIAEQLKET
ncbi:MAG: hypothetical protein ACTHMM_05415 [Agriterribacter sp.]